MFKYLNLRIAPLLLAAATTATLSPNCARADGPIWPANQLLPTFPTPAANLDCIDVSSSSAAEIDLFASLEGIVNRTQPRIACVSSVDSEGKFIWLSLHNLPYTLVSGYTAIMKYQTNVAGLVVTDPAQPDTLNLATTIAGVSNLLICDPSLLTTLTNPPYSLPIGQDLRGKFSNKYQIYGYLYTNYWPQCTHRMITGLYTNIHGELRDYLVALKVATVWLDPGTLNFSDKNTLAPFLNDMTALNGIYTGWWPDEGNGLNWIAQYGIPVLASDYFRNASVFSGIPRTINVPDIPPPPPLTNKVYVALILSDGDNIQYMQHVMKIDWDKTVRGSIPIGWTVSPLAADLDPVMLNHYWNTATTNDCLISGPSGAGYCHIQNWSSANIAGLTRISDSYLQRGGIRVITIWDQVTTGVARSFATNCPSLLGLTDQSGGNYTSVNLGLRTIGLSPAYSSTVSDILTGITNAANSWNGVSPMFIAAQAVVWSLGPSDLKTIASALDPNKYVIVRPDHLFMLNNQLAGNPLAVTKSPVAFGSASAALKGFVIPNGPSATAWFEWGTNLNYGSKTTSTNVSGKSLVNVSTGIGGLLPGVTYHYRVAVSNALGVVRGVDKTYKTSGILKVWGDGSLGQTNVPPGLSNIVGISCGANHGLALKNDGSVFAWGDNSFNQTNVPPALANVVQVAAGAQHSVALASGAVVVWGDYSLGQTNVPAGLGNVVEVAAGGYHTLALKADGTVIAWGSNNLGQTNVPVGLSNVVSAAAGKYHSLALKADGTVVCWGNTSFGLTSVPAGLSQVVAVSAGDAHNLALKADGISPANLFPAVRWVADALTVGDGAAVSAWSDGVAGKNAAQSSPGNQPIFHTNVLNGHGVIRFSGASSQYLTVTAADSPISGASDFTLVTVMKSSTPGLSSSSFFQNTGVLGCEQPGSVADWALCLNGNQLGAGLGAGASGCSADVSLYGGNVTDGKPHVVAYERSAGTIRIYVDGAIVAVQNSLCTGTRGGYDFQIGAMTTGSGYFTGDIAEIQLYNRALSISEMATVTTTLAGAYGMGGVAGAPQARWVADSLSGSDGSFISAWTDSLSGRTATQANAGNRPRLYSNIVNGHKIVRFAAVSSQYLTVAVTNSPFSAAGSFTAIVVLKTSTLGNSSSLFYQNTGLLGAEQSGVVADWAMCINNSQLGAGLGAGGSACGPDLSLYGGNVTDGVPHIAMWVRSGDTMTLYVDGVMVASQSGLCSAARGNYPFQIGAMAPGLNYFTGDIAEIQLYDRALNSSEISSANETLAATYNIGGAARNVVVWGSNSNGQTNVPPGLTNLVTAASGSLFNLALKKDGSFLGWGDNSSGQTSILPGLTNVSAIAGGSGFAAGLGNQTPLANNLAVSGYLNHDLTFALPGVDPDGNPLSFRVLSLPLSGSLYQYSSGARGAPITLPNTTVSDPAGQVVFAPAPGESGSPYATFTFVTADAFYNSAAAQATIGIGLPSAPQFSDSYSISADGSFGLSFSGSSNATYSVWASTNLVDWSILGTATEAGPGWYQFSDVTATNWPSRFYRAGAP